MNECDESIPAMESRKKKRGFGFRFSSRKELECSRLIRLAKARGCEVTSVTRTLSYPSLIPSELCFSDIYYRAASSCESPILVSIDEFEAERKEMSKVNDFKVSAYPKTVSSFKWMCLCLGIYHIYYRYILFIKHV
jgi:hypothetical protein